MTPDAGWVIAFSVAVVVAVLVAAVIVARRVWGTARKVGRLVDALASERDAELLAETARNRADLEHAAARLASLTRRVAALEQGRHADA